ncbi:histidine kinase [Prosthecobacter sp.]|uniref:histidine kinase n=1 Tax=Prosthecobacter sp. TaxID=1965333 RepID=UPI002ABA9536|nr:histidine kinase [Prosthecobacter sp.]MDZ4402030.1 histidine kinase [Prosthecobacter sp.]
MKPWLLSLALVTTAAQAGVPWAWLNSKLTRLDYEHQWLHAELNQLPPMPVPQPHEHAGFHSGITAQPDAVRWIQIDLGVERALDAVVVIPAMLGAAEVHGFPRRFRIDASNDPLFAESTTLLDQTVGDVAMPLAPWFVPALNVKARHVRFTATKLVPKPRLANQFIFCLGELLVFSGGRNVALHAPVLAPKSVETLPTWSPRHVVDGCHALGLPLRADAVNGNGWHSAIFTRADSTSWLRVDLGSVRDIDEIRLIPAHPRDYPDRFGFGFPQRFKIEADGKIIFDSTTADFTNPGDTPVAFSTPGLRARSIQITATRLWERSGDFVFALAELQAFANGQNIAREATVTSSDSTITAAWNHANLLEGRASAGVLLDEARWLADLSKRREFEGRLAFLDIETNLAVRKAQERAVYLALALTAIGIGATLAFLLHLRRSRRLEMEALRQRISRDLHDEIGSHLGSIRLMSELALREDGASESLEEIHRLAGEAADSMRGIIWLVREGDAPKLTSLVEAMRQSAAALLKGIDWHLNTPSGDDPTTASLEFHRQVFLFFREAAHNITRHAQATRVMIEITWQAKRFTLRIEDNGCGFDADAVTAGNGLANLRHRAEVLDGTLHITSVPGKGTRITLEATLP